jgi:hypothetical protein
VIGFALGDPIISYLVLELPHTTHGKHPTTGLLRGTDEYKGIGSSLPHGDTNSLGNEVTGIDAVWMEGINF